jgi:hypothetical protein
MDMLFSTRMDVTALVILKFGVCRNWTSAICPQVVAPGYMRATRCALGATLFCSPAPGLVGIVPVHRSETPSFAFEYWFTGFAGAFEHFGRSTAAVLCRAFRASAALTARNCGIPGRSGGGRALRRTAVAQRRCSRWVMTDDRALPMRSRERRSEGAIKAPK